MICEICGQWHNSLGEIFDCLEWAPEPYDEDGEIAMMRVLETNEVQRWETEQEEGMIAALWH